MKIKFLLKTFLSLCGIFGLAITVHAQNLYVSVNGPLGFGNSDGSIFEYTPTGIQTTFASGIPRPRGLAFSSSSNLYAAISAIVDDHLVGKVVTFNPQRKPTPIGAVPFYGTFEGIAIDALGNVYVLTVGGRYPSTIFKFVPGLSRSVFGTVPGAGFGLAFDSAGNLYAADSGSDIIPGLEAIYKFAPDGTRTVFAGPDAFPDSFPVGLAFDSSGNLFVSTEGNPGNDSILVFAPDATESTFATGLTQPRGLAFDSAGNLFVAETLAAPLGDILKFPAGGGSPTVFASGIDRPEFLTLGPPR
jgi:sugar lactone lactonase YvrE